MRILLLATRPLDGPMTGRKAVLRTIVRSCRALGHELDVLVVGARGPLADARAVAGPGLLRIGMNLAVEFLWRGRSLNECLYWSPVARAEIERIVAEGRYALVIADMVRTAQYCAGLRVPWVLDLDDLLSHRYERLARGGEQRAILGYFSERLPQALRGPAGWAASRLLRVESGRLAAQELEFARRAHAVTLVSPIEARHLQTRLGRLVHDAPMAVDIPALGSAVAGPDDAVVFLGSLGYQPNWDALSFYLREIAPRLRQRGRGVRLDVVGAAPQGLRIAAAEGTLRYLGYVDDVADTLRRYRVFVAPIVSGTGIKTKVLEAMACGLAVVATEEALAGLDLQPGRECLLARTPDEFADAVCRLLDEPQTCARLGEAARQFAARGYALDVLRERWRLVLDAAQQDFARRAGRSPQPAGT